MPGINDENIFGQCFSFFFFFFALYKENSQLKQAGTLQNFSEDNGLGPLECGEAGAELSWDGVRYGHMVWNRQMRDRLGRTEGGRDSPSFSGLLHSLLLVLL